MPRSRKISAALSRNLWPSYTRIREAMAYSSREGHAWFNCANISTKRKIAIAGSHELPERSGERFSVHSGTEGG